MLVIIDLEIIIVVVHTYIEVIIFGIVLIIGIYGDEPQTQKKLGNDLVIIDIIYLD
jgi:hypothetical protein